MPTGAVTNAGRTAVDAGKGAGQAIANGTAATIGQGVGNSIGSADGGGYNMGDMYAKGDSQLKQMQQMQEYQLYMQTQTQRLSIAADTDAKTISSSKVNG